MPLDFGIFHYYETMHYTYMDRKCTDNTIQVRLKAPDAGLGAASGMTGEGREHMAFTTTTTQLAAGSGGPRILFGAAALASLAVLALPATVIPGDWAQPLVSLSLFGLAAATALAARRRSTAETLTPSYSDVAGALTFMGICVAALVEPEQMARLVDDFHR